MYTLPFIRLSQHNAFFETLNHALMVGGVTVIAGDGSAGKSRLLKQFVLTELTALEFDQVAGVRLSRPKKLDTGRFGSTVTFDLFSKLLRDLRLLFALPRSEERDLLRDKLQQDPRRRTYSEESWYDLFFSVVDAMSRVRCLLLDDVHHLDETTLWRIMELWEACERRFAIVLCGNLATNVSIEEFTQRLAGTVPPISKSITDVLPVSMMDRRTFRGEVLDIWFKALDANRAKGLEDGEGKARFDADAWLVTKGNWDSITTLSAEFKVELDRQNRSPRLITKEVAERIFHRRLKILGLLSLNNSVSPSQMASHSEPGTAVDSSPSIQRDLGLQEATRKTSGK